MANPLRELLRQPTEKELQVGRYTVFEPMDPQSLERLFRQRHGVYLDEGFIEPDAFPGACFRDVFDSIATHIAAFDPEGEVIGSSRVVPPTELGLPTHRLFHLPPLGVEPALIGEVGRLAIDRTHRGGARFVVLGIITRLYHGLRRHGLTHFVAFMHPDLERMLTRLRIPVKPIEPLEPTPEHLAARAAMAGYFSRGHVRPTLTSLDAMAEAIGI